MFVFVTIVWERSLVLILVQPELSFLSTLSEAILKRTVISTDSPTTTVNKSGLLTVSSMLTTQCEAVTTHSPSIREPPQMCSNLPRWRTLRETCQGHECFGAFSPPTTREIKWRLPQPSKYNINALQGLIQAYASPGWTYITSNQVQELFCKKILFLSCFTAVLINIHLPVEFDKLLTKACTCLL